LGGHTHYKTEALEVLKFQGIRAQRGKKERETDGERRRETEGVIEERDRGRQKE